MLQPSSITALLTQLIQTDADGRAVKPHTALLSLVDSSELYAFSTRLSEASSPAAKSTIAAVLADTAAASGSTRPRGPTRRLSGLSLDERATCLSAIAVASWRQAVGLKTPAANGDRVSFIASPGTKITVSASQHAVTGISSPTATSQDLVPLLLECELGRLLVMPIVPAVPQMSASRAELAAAEYSHDEPMYADAQKPFMLLTLNAELAAAPSEAKPAQPLSTARTRLLSGGNTPTSISSDATATPLRSPLSEHFPTEEAVSPGEDEAAWEQAVWSGLFGQAKAFARMMAPSLAKCGVGVHHDDDHPVDERRSGQLSEDETDEP